MIEAFGADIGKAENSNMMSEYNKCAKEVADLYSLSGAEYENISLDTTTDYWTSVEYSYIYGLKAIGTGDGAYIEINGEKIQIPKDANKEYLNINKDIVITAYGPLAITVSGQKQKLSEA